MKRLLIRWFLFGLLSRPIIRAVDWTKEERNQFDLFCKSSCGIKLFEFLRQIVATSTFNAVYDSESVSAASARARGMQDILALLHRLRVFPLQEESSAFDEAGLLKAAKGEAPERESDQWRWVGGRGAIGR
jgi:hypothetical protein